MEIVYPSNSHIIPLDNCPLCGKEAVFIEDTEEQVWFASCTECGLLLGSPNGYSSRLDLCNDWNTRVDMSKKKLTLREAILPLTESKTDLVVKWAKQYGIEVEYKGPGQYKVINGIIPNIMLYPTKLKLMFQDGGRNYVITSRTEDSVVGLIMGNIPFKKEGE